MLRAARQAQGLHIAALATMLKVAPRKLEALENDQYDELQGVAFVRAMAQAACRALKLDPVPVLGLLPRPEQVSLGQVSGGLNAPFRERGMKRDPAEGLLGNRGLLLAVVALVLAALAFWWLPFDLVDHLGQWLPRSAPASGPTDAGQADAASKPLFPLTDSSVTTSSGTITEPALSGQTLPAESGVVAKPGPGALPSASSPASAAASTAVALPATSMATSSAVPPLPAVATPTLIAAATAALPASGPLVIKARAASWVEVIDAKGKSLIGRVLAAGETVELDGRFPLAVKIGNAGATEVVLRGRAVGLEPQTRDNVARLELK
jgi:cytoskeleton protein RodZ